MTRALLLTIITILASVSSETPLSCQRSVPRIQDGIYDYKSLLEKVPSIRVLILKDVREAQLAVYGSYQITGNLRTILDQGQGLPRSRISVASDTITIGNKQYRNNEVWVAGSRDGDIELNGIRYHGEIRILQQFNGKLSVIGEVDLENYIAGVVGSEMFHSWNEDALRAQAITARTYAMYKRKVRQNNTYHLDILELAYRGIAGETEKINRIVQETRGVVMVYNWNIFPSYFHSTCGGHTEDCKHVFGKDSIPPLRGVVCNYCNSSRYASWSKSISKSEIEKKLRDANISVSNIHAINTLNPGEGDHGSKVEIVSDEGNREMDANGFRLLIGPNYLYSTAFSSKNTGKNITFSGKGLGHGVGLCQYGAQSMAESGFDYTTILKHYYPGVELIRVY